MWQYAVKNNLNTFEISWGIRLWSLMHIWNTRVIAELDMIDISNRYMHLNQAGAGPQYIPHYGTWHLLGRPRPLDAWIALVFHNSQAIVSSPQATGHNVPTCPLPPTTVPTALFSVDETQYVTCPYPNCKFQHVCYICAYDPKATDISHKAIHCPKHRALGPSQVVPGP